MNQVPATPVTLTPERIDHYCGLMEFVLDCLDPEMYGHAMPPDALRRASKLVGLFRQRANVQATPAEIAEVAAAEVE